MKLIVLLVVFATTIVADPPLVFKTEFNCLQHEGRWCAVAYFFEIDTFEGDDAILSFRFCTVNTTKTVQIKTDPLGGDGGFYGLLQNEYEIGYKVYHTCSPSKRSCSQHTTYQTVQYNTDKEQMIYNKINWPKDSLDNNSTACFFPDAYLYRGFLGEDKDIKGKKFRDVPNTHQFDTINGMQTGETYYWTPTRSGTF